MNHHPLSQPMSVDKSETMSPPCTCGAAEDSPEMERKHGNHVSHDMSAAHQSSGHSGHRYKSNTSQAIAIMQGSYQTIVWCPLCPLSSANIIVIMRRVTQIK